eukprot:10664437-Heterocapsa_arctica.AAC.1
MPWKATRAHVGERRGSLPARAPRGRSGGSGGHLPAEVGESHPRGSSGRSTRTRRAHRPRDVLCRA